MTDVAPGHLATEALGDERALPNVAWIAALTGASAERVGAVLRETDRFLSLESTIRSRQLLGGREFYAQLQAPLDLYAIVRLTRPTHIVETGVSSGVSSAHFLLGLRENRSGLLHSIDLPTMQRAVRLAKAESPVSLPPGRSSGFAIPDELRPGWDLHLGPSEAILPVVAKSLDRIDLFLHDSLHTPEHLTFELETIRPLLRPGSVVLADNTEWTGDSFDRFAASLHATVHARGGSDLLGLVVPGPSRTAATRTRSSVRPRPRARGTRSARATRSR